MGAPYTSKYKELGVDAWKRGVEVFRGLIASEAPYSFTPLLRDPDVDEYMVLHVDGAGSKPIVAYLYYKETGSTNYFRGLPQDVMAMNIDDVVAVGAKPVAFSDYVAINPLRLPKSKVLYELTLGFMDVLETLSRFRPKVEVVPLFSGGETADLPDQVRTLDIVGFVYGRVSPSRAITGEHIPPGSIIVGFESGGRAVYESVENSGIMCNGLTLARHVLLDSRYKKEYPETCEPLVSGTYRGRYKVDTYLDELGMSVGEALLSPTRIYAPIVMESLERCTEHIKGMAHITGGGLTKLLHLGDGVKYIVDKLPEPNPIFRLIQREGRIAWREMYEVFNMGIGFVVIVDCLKTAETVVDIADKYRVKAYIIGRTEREKAGVNSLVLRGFEGSVHSYTLETG